MTNVVKKLNTWLPIDVFENLHKFTLENTSTALGKFDYATAIRILLIKSQYADLIFDLDKRIQNIEKQKATNNIPAGYREIPVLGDTNSKGGK